MVAFGEKASWLQLQQRERSSCPLLGFLFLFSPFSPCSFTLPVFALDLPAASQKYRSHFHSFPSKSAWGDINNIGGINKMSCYLCHWGRYCWMFIYWNTTHPYCSLWPCLSLSVGCFCSLWIAVNIQVIQEGAKDIFSEGRHLLYLNSELLGYRSSTLCSLMSFHLHWPHFLCTESIALLTIGFNIKEKLHHLSYSNALPITSTQLILHS